ncbi:MAG TPA: ATP-binding cassette domain-containing protein [Caulobacteraceae bacterium]
MTTAQPALRVQHLAKRYAGGAGVSDVNLTVEPGQIAGFIGVNGAGKSTTLRCILGLSEPDAGNIEIFGRRASFSARAPLGFLPEERGLAPRDRARDAIAFHARLKGASRAKAYERADALLTRIGLGGRERTRIGELSKGNAQRVQILCALAHDPALLILDEPFSGLDPIAQGEIRVLFAEFRAMGGSILFSTHAMSFAEELCDKVVILSNGRTVFEGAVSEAAMSGGRHGAYVVSADDDAVLAAAADVGGDAEALTGAAMGAVRWRILLPASVTHPVLMRALAARGARIFDFKPIEAGLESALWNHVLGGERSVA